jgi:tyrosine-protein phosphatase
MADHRSLPASDSTRRITNSSRSIDWRAYSRFWFRPGSGKLVTEPVGSQTRLVSPRTVSNTNMSATKELPHPASSSPLVDFPTPSEYAEKVFGRFHHHNISDSSATSNDSSPTTTCSTIDDSSATEPSPGSSPESPPPNSFKTGMFRPRTSHEQTAPFFELQKAAPPKKGRNLKNLAVNTSRTPGRASSTTSLPLSQNMESEPAIMSPSFVKPPSPPKRKPSNLGLTIRTPASINPSLQQIKLAIPPTPSFGRPGTLRHFQSSPSLPLFPILGTERVMAPKLYQNTTLETIFSPTEPPQIQAKVDEEQNFDIPLSKEEKPEAYPDGPICVHEPYIDLYLEPTAEQARQYDVVMNVAVEVRNPLDPLAEPKSPEPEVRLDGGGGIQYAPKRDNLPRPLEQRQPSSPTTPRATPSSLTIQPQATLGTGAHDPEYIHIPWEHNSDIVPDLLRLVKLIDERVTQKKRVLVHCQCGVSRSASLVVAYGLYKDPSLSVQEAYDAVKARSKWIGPNMVRLADVLKLDFPADKSTEFHHATARVQVKPRPWRPASREPRFVANHSCFRAQRVAQSFLGTIDRDWTSLCGSFCWICQPEPTYP